MTKSKTAKTWIMKKEGSLNRPKILLFKSKERKRKSEQLRKRKKIKIKRLENKQNKE